MQGSDVDSFFTNDPIHMSNILKISVRKGKDGYGFVLSNQAPCVVSSITKGGPADIAKLGIGDEILEVNNQNVSTSSHQQVVRLILRRNYNLLALTIRRLSETHTALKSAVDLHSEKEDFHKSVLETVHKVVGDLTSGNHFKDNEDYREKKPHIQKRRSKPLLHEHLFEDHVPRLPFEFSKTDVSSREHRLAGDHTMKSQDFSSPLSKDFTQKTPLSDYRVVVGYLRTVELPDSKNLSLASQNALSSCKRSLHVTSKKVTKHFLMTISRNGIKLSSSHSENYATYPLKLISYTCSCPEDDKLFGIVTRKELNYDNLSSSPYEPRHKGQMYGNVCSCHIFMLDPMLSSHSAHKTEAKKFGFSCHQITRDGLCEEFPLTSLIILEEINSLFQEMSFDDVSYDSPDTLSPVQMKSNINEDFNALEGLTLNEDLLQWSPKYIEHSMEIKHFARSPFRQRKPIAENLFDNPMEQICVKVDTELNSGQDSLASPTIEDPFEVVQDPVAVMLPHSANESSGGNDKGKETEQSLELLLKCPAGLQSFEDFLKKEHSEENIMFWKDVESFRLIDDSGKLRRRANEIYHTYLAGGAPGLVNVDQKAVKKAEEKLINPDANMFDLQQQQIFMLMKYDCFPRFLKSEFYKRTPLIPNFQELDEDMENKDNRKRKSQWYLKIMSSSKDSGIKSKNEADASEQTEKKKTLLGLWSKGKGPKVDGKSRDKPGKLGKLRARHDSQSSLSDGSSKPTTPNFTEDRKRFDLPKSPSEIKELVGSEAPFCRVILPNGSSNVVVLESGHPIKHVLQTCCTRQKLQLSSYDIFAGEERKSVDLQKDAMFFAGEVFQLERKIQFRFDLPNKRSVAVMDSPSKTLYEVIEPIMRKNGYEIDRYIIHITNNNIQLPLQTGIAAIENKHLVTEEKSQDNISWKPPAGNAADLRTSFRRLRQSSKDDSSLIIRSRNESKPARTQERRGSLEGRRSYFTRLKQGIKNNTTMRSKSIDHTTFALKAVKQQQDGEPDQSKKNQHIPSHSRQHSAPLYDRPYDASETDGSTILDDLLSAGVYDKNGHESDPHKFRPASEVIFAQSEEKEFFDRRASVPLARIVRDDGELADFTRKDVSHPDISALSTHLHPRSKFVKNMHATLNAAVSDPELAVRRGRAKNIKALKEDIGRRGSDASNNSPSNSARKYSERRPRSDAEIGQNRRLSRNLLSWRSRQNSSDSVTSSATEDTDAGKSRKLKRDDVKRYSSPEPVILKNYPRSPRNKQKKLEMADAEIAIANSPVYLVEVGSRCNGPKDRPQPISVADESDILRGLDLEESYDNVSTPSSAKTEESTNSLDDSFENVLDTMNWKDNATDETKNGGPFLKLHEQGDNLNRTDTLNDTGNKSNVAVAVDVVDSAATVEDVNLPDPDYEHNATVTGSVNDETLIMEDKDTGLDLSGLMDMTNVKRNRKGVKPKGEKEQKVKETAITFV